MLYVIVLFIVFVLYVFFLTVYRLYLHPLASYPGPKTAAVSRWPEFYYDVVQKGQFCKVIDQYHEKYGRAP